MKKLLILTLSLILFSACSTNNLRENVDPTSSAESPIPEETVTPIPTSTPSTNKDEFGDLTQSEFVQTSINGLFDVYIINPLPKQMEFKCKKISESSGVFQFNILSSKENCKNEEACSNTPFAYLYGTDDDREDLYVDDETPIFQVENTSVGTINIWRCYTCNLNNTIQEGAPDYYKEGVGNTLEESQLILFEKH